MSYQEIKNEILADVKESRIYERANVKVSNSENKYRRIAYKTEGFRAFEPIQITSKRGNTYYFMPFSRGKSFYKKEGAKYILSTFFHTKQGLCCATVSKCGKNISLYYAHLFRRYAERHDHSGLIDRIGIIKYGLRFMAENSITITQAIPSEKHGDNAVCGHANHGLIFGNKEEDITVFKTFVSTDMLYESQVEIKNFTHQYIKEYMKENFENIRLQQRRFARCA